jgi:hypothetical protein
MSKVTYDNLLSSPLSATCICLQLADQSIHYPEGIAKDILVKLHEDYVPMDFVVLNHYQVLVLAFVSPSFLPD